MKEAHLPSSQEVRDSVEVHRPMKAEYHVRQKQRLFLLVLPVQFTLEMFEKGLFLYSVISPMGLAKVENLI